MKDWNEKPVRKQQPQLRVIEPRLPYDEKIEAVVLATLVDRPTRLDAVIDMLRPEDFYVWRHRALYEVMLGYYRKHGKGADFLMLSNLLEENEDVKPSDVADMLALRDELFSFDFGAGVRKMIGLSTQRRNIFASQELATIGYNIADPDEARAAVEKLLYDLTMQATPTSDFEHIDDISMAVLSDADKAYRNRGVMLGIPTGYHDLDLLTSGLQRSDLLILAARPSQGKTSLAMNIAYNAAKKGHAVAAFSLEMSKKQLVTRLYSVASGIPSNRIRTGWMDGDEWDRMQETQQQLGELCLYIDDVSNSPVSSMRSKLRRLMARSKRAIDLIVVDYLQFMEDEEADGRRRENRNQEVSHISRGLKGLAREFNAPVLALAQLSRAVEGRKEKKPQLSDLRDSGAIEQDADVVMFIYHDEKQETTVDVLVEKHRNGPTGVITLNFDRALTRFTSIDFTQKPAWNDTSEEDTDGE